MADVIEEEENGGPVVSERVQVSYIYVCMFTYICHPLSENQPSGANCFFSFINLMLVVFSQPYILES